MPHSLLHCRLSAREPSGKRESTVRYCRHNSLTPPGALHLPTTKLQANSGGTNLMDVMPAPEAPCDASSPNCIPQGLGRLLQETPAFSLGCDPSGQRLALTLVYYLVNGPGWINNSGWPSMPMQGTNPFAIALHMAAVPLETGVCTSASQSSADTPAVILPDHCCWYGVRCCTPQTCGNNPFCNCTIGLITSLQLNGNRVRV